MFAGSISWDAENVCMVVAAWFVNFASVAAEGGANAFVAIGLHAHALTGATDEHAKMAFSVVTKDCFGDFARIIVEVVFAVILDGTKIGESNFTASEPFDYFAF